MADGYVLWEGVSQIDGRTPVVLVATGVRGSSNRKTGAMLQTYILRADMGPIAAVSDRLDGGICGGCVHRKQPNGKRSCYVNLGHGPTSVYGAYVRGSYPVAHPSEIALVGAGQFVRLGTYGDPAAVPVEVWRELVSLSIGHTGYTHQWRAPKFREFGALVQASCETAQDVERAHLMGFAGTFRVIPIGEPVPLAGMLCPASAEAGHKVQCADCRACAGRNDVHIYAHGAGATNYTGGRALPVLS